MLKINKQDLSNVTGGIIHSEQLKNMYSQSDDEIRKKCFPDMPDLHKEVLNMIFENIAISGDFKKMQMDSDYKTKIEEESINNTTECIRKKKNDNSEFLKLEIQEIWKKYYIVG